MSYTIEISRRARKAMLRLPTDVQAQMEQAIDALAIDPRPHGCVKMKGREREWRIVVRKDYRVEYEVLDDRLLIYVIEAGPRGGMYKRR